MKTIHYPTTTSPIVQYDPRFDHMRRRTSLMHRPVYRRWGMLLPLVIGVAVVAWVVGRVL